MSGPTILSYTLYDHSVYHYYLILSMVVKYTNNCELNLFE